MEFLTLVTLVVLLLLPERTQNVPQKNGFECIKTTVFPNRFTESSQELRRQSDAWRNSVVDHEELCQGSASALGRCSFQQTACDASTR